MCKTTRHWKLSAWIACLAILFNAFAPILSHAGESRATPAATAGMEVCTALGMRMMPWSGAALSDAADAGDALEHGQLHKNMQHCGFCLAHAASHGLPPPPALLFTAGASREVYPPLHYHAPRPLFPWSLAQPRAPPVLA